VAGYADFLSLQREAVRPDGAPADHVSTGVAMQRFQSKGLSLAETAIVIVIIALAIGGLLMPLVTQFELSRVRETERQLEIIRESLIGFAIANGRLPCPALPMLPTGGAVAAGAEALTSAAPPVQPPGATGRWCQTDDGSGVETAISAGVLPWATLGVPETDPWGRRFTYVVTSIFADEGGCASTNPNVASFCTTAIGQLSLNTRTSAGGPTPPIANGVAAMAAVRFYRMEHRWR
jgi:type II secretory pathway pseudopilin PulG